VIEMATTEERVDKLEEKYSDLHTVVNVLAAKIDNLVDELKDFKQEMRDKDNQRQAEIAEIRQSTDAKFESIRQSIQTMQNQNVVVIIGVIAIAVAVFLK